MPSDRQDAGRGVTDTGREEVGSSASKFDNFLPALASGGLVKTVVMIFYFVRPTTEEGTVP